MLPSRGVWLAAVVLVGAGCSKKEAKEAEAVVPVETAPVRREAIRRIVRADGVLYPRDQAAITPKLSAPIRTFYVNRGDHVHQGQLLAVLENRDLAGAALESKAQYEQAEATYRSTTAASLPEELNKAKLDAQASQQALDAAKKLYESRQQLFKEGALARRLVDEAQVAYVQARAQAENAERHLSALENVGREQQMKGAAAQLEAAKAHYESAAAQLSYSEIRSPLTGVVTERPLYAGEMAAAGSPLITLMDVSQIVARANVPESEAGGLRVGAPASISGGDLELAGKVTVVSPAVDPNSTTVQVWVAAANPGERMKPGTTVHVAIVAATVTDALVVPPAALLPSPTGGSSALVVGKDSLVHARDMEVGIREPDKVQVLKGLSEGDQVVTVGGLGLQDGARVRVGAEAPAGKKDE